MKKERMLVAITEIEKSLERLQTLTTEKLAIIKEAKEVLARAVIESDEYVKTADMKTAEYFQKFLN